MPSTTSCPHCGRPLRPRTVKVLSREVRLGFHPCDCEKAREEEAILEERERRAAAERDEERISRAVERSGIPARYRDAVVDKPDLCDKALESGLYIQGPSGTGKTTMACAIGIMAIRRGLTVRFVKAGLITSMLSNFEADEALVAFRAPDLLIIDDLGMDAINDWSNSKIRLAIDARSDAGKPIIITSNYSKTELAGLLSRNKEDKGVRAIISRLCGMTEKYELDGQDRRVG